MSHIIKEINVIVVVGMEETSCDRKEVMQELVGDVNKYFVTEGPFGRIRAINNDVICKQYIHYTVHQ